MTVAIVDYGMGNLFNVQRAFLHVGLETEITDDPEKVAEAEGVVLPGVGAFGDAMAALDAKGLSGAMKDAVAAEKPFLGVCLGMQLLMAEGHEFGTHKGLGILAGDVVRFDGPRDGERILKVPQVGWNRVHPAAGGWAGTPLQGVEPGAFMYFVHSYHVRPADPSAALAVARYGQIEFCAALRRGNVFACQFHPERSGPAGLDIFRAFARRFTGGDK